MWRPTDATFSGATLRAALAVVELIRAEQELHALPAAPRVERGATHVREELHASPGALPVQDEIPAPDETRAWQAGHASPHVASGGTQPQVELPAQGAIPFPAVRLDVIPVRVAQSEPDVSPAATPALGERGFLCLAPAWDALHAEPEPQESHVLLCAVPSPGETHASPCVASPCGSESFRVFPVRAALPETPQTGGCCGQPAQGAQFHAQPQAHSFVRWSRVWP